MELTAFHFLLICPMVFIAGLIDAVAGGGGLISLPAYMIAGLPPHNAIATNKMSSCMGTSLATFRYARSGFINWKIAIFAVICALVGSAIGSNIALLISARNFTFLMLIILPVTGFIVMKSKVLDSDKEPLSEGRSILVAMASAFVIGVYDGFYGPGTGTFLILLLTGFAHMKLTDANGITKAINLTTNVTALTVFLLNGKVMILLGVVAGAFNIAGNYLGTRLFTDKGAKVVKPFLVLVLTIFFIKCIYDLFIAV